MNGDHRETDDAGKAPEKQDERVRTVRAEIR
jgi:hypothetical protein